MFKNSDDINGWSIGHILLGMLAGIIFTWNKPTGVVALFIVFAWEWVEYYLAQRGWLLRYIDAEGVSIFDLYFDIFGFVLFVMSYYIFRK